MIRIRTEFFVPHSVVARHSVKGESDDVESRRGMRDQDLTRFPLEDGSIVAVEVDRPGGEIYEDVGYEDVGYRGGRIREASTTVDVAMDQIRRAANAVLLPLTRVHPRPDDVELSFGVRLNAEAGAVIGNQGDGHFSVRLVWRSAAAPTGSPEAAD
jgi:hypothetical protein